MNRGVRYAKLAPEFHGGRRVGNCTKTAGRKDHQKTDQNPGQDSILDLLIATVEIPGKAVRRGSLFNPPTRPHKVSEDQGVNHRSSGECSQPNQNMCADAMIDLGVPTIGQHWIADLQPKHHGNDHDDVGKDGQSQKNSFHSSGSRREKIAS